MDNPFLPINLDDDCQITSSSSSATASSTSSSFSASLSRSSSVSPASIPSSSSSSSSKNVKERRRNQILDVSSPVSYHHTLNLLKIDNQNKRMKTASISSSTKIRSRATFPCSSSFSSSSFHHNTLYAHSFPLPPRDSLGNRSRNKGKEVDVISTLPATLMHLVLSYLDGVEAFLVVCKLSSHFRLIICRHPRREQRSSNCTLNYSLFAAQITDIAFQLCFHNAVGNSHHLLHLNLAHCSKITASILIQVLSQCIHLVTLNCSHTQITLNSLTPVIAELKCLKELQLSSAADSPTLPLVDRIQTVVTLISQLNTMNLRKLDLSACGILYCHNPLQEAVCQSNIQSQQAQEITHLSLSQNVFKEKGLAMFHSFLTKHLLYLDLSHCQLLPGFCSFMTCKSLLEVNLSGSSSQHDLSLDIACIIRQSNSLRLLNVSCLKLRSSAFQIVSPRSEMRELVLSECTGVDASSLTQIISIFPHLKTLNLCDTMLSNEFFDAFITDIHNSSSLRRLESLDVSRNYLLSNNVLERLIKELMPHSLKKINVLDCRHVSINRLRDFIAQRHRGTNIFTLLHPKCAERSTKKTNELLIVEENQVSSKGFLSC